MPKRKTFIYAEVLSSAPLIPLVARFSRLFRYQAHSSTAGRTWTKHCKLCGLHLECVASKKNSLGTD